jgi:hypothetical protein
MRVLQIEGMKGKENGFLGWMVSHDIHMYIYTLNAHLDISEFSGKKKLKFCLNLDLKF